MADAVLTLNAGSSSVKFSLFEVRGREILLKAHGEAESLDTEPHFHARDSKGAVLADETWPQQDFVGLIGMVIGWVENHLGSETLAAVGHRVVHGGADHIQPELVTPDLIQALDRLTPLAPLHQPHNLEPIRAIAATRPQLAQVVCFDTAFHHTMPAVAARFALPRALEDDGLRRYGFHGLSYEYIAGRLREIAPMLAAGRVIAAHLGNGASLCAMLDGLSIETTMSFTPLDGLVMGTRCGSLDPGVSLYLQRARGLSVDEIEDMLYHRSGLLGVSGIASDMRALLASRERPAQEAVELFVYRVIREIGALTSVLGGLDGLVFTGGIGEHAPEIRAMICSRLGWLGVTLDEAANAGGAAIISAPSSQIAVRVLPTDEEAMIARHTLDIIRAGADESGC